MASTTTSVYSLFDASDMSAVSFIPMKASDTAPNVSTVGYQMVLSTHCSHMATKPNRLPNASPTQRNTPPCLSWNIAASSAATNDVGIRNTSAANR